MIVFVMGLWCAGKSTFIKQNFSNFYKVDFMDYQNNVLLHKNDILETYEKCKNALIDAVKKYENVVFEDSLLTEESRKYYKDAIQSMNPTEIEIYVINPSTKEIVKNAKKANKFLTEENIEFKKEQLKLPSTNEGFKKINIIYS